MNTILLSVFYAFGFWFSFGFWVEESKNNDDHDLFGALVLSLLWPMIALIRSCSVGITVSKFMKRSRADNP